MDGGETLKRVYLKAVGLMDSNPNLGCGEENGRRPVEGYFIRKVGTNNAACTELGDGGAAVLGNHVAKVKRGEPLETEPTESSGDILARCSMPQVEWRHSLKVCK